jgi:aspartyl-tRNA(Asn)/glutamyl-tRNA(Gln) amidotransferase subunit A
VGALAPNVRTAAQAIALMAGWPMPELGGGGAGERASGAGEGAGGLRLARPARWVDDLDEETARVWADFGAGLPAIELPERTRMSELAVTIQAAEATAFHLDWMRRWPDRYSPDVLTRLNAGLEVKAVDYLRAQEERVRIREQVEEALGIWDALVLPATAIVAPPLRKPEQRDGLLRFTRPFSLTGHPCVVIPAPVTGLPVGIQLVGRIGADARLAEVAYALEQSWS